MIKGKDALPLDQKDELKDVEPSTLDSYSFILIKDAVFDELAQVKL